MSADFTEAVRQRIGHEFHIKILEDSGIWVIDSFDPECKDCPGAALAAAAVDRICARPPV